MSRAGPRRDRRSRRATGDGGCRTRAGRSQGVGLSVVGQDVIGPAEASIALELDPQAAEGVMEWRLDGAELDTENLGGLLERQALEVVEDDDAAVLFRQGGYPLPDDLAQLCLLCPLGGQRTVVGKAVFGRIVDRTGLEPPPRQPRIAEVERDAVEPGQRRDVLVERVAVPMRPRERVLEDLFRGQPVTRQAVCGPIDRVAVASKKLFEGVQIVGLDTAQQLRVHLLIGRRRGASRSVVDRLFSVFGCPPPVLLIRYAAESRKVQLRIKSRRRPVCDRRVWAFRARR